MIENKALDLETLLLDISQLEINKDGLRKTQ